MEIRVEDEGAESYEEVMLIYDAALKQIVVVVKFGKEESR